jgi:hypothetical protein
MGCRFSKQQRAPGPGRHNWFEPSTQGMHAADSRLSPRIFHAADIEPTICEPRACQKPVSQHCAWRQIPHTSILGCFGIRSAPPHTSYRRLRGVYHVLAVISAAVARIYTRGLIVIAGAYATTTCDFSPRFEEDAGRTRVNHRFEHASWAQTDGTSPLEHGHVSVACLKTSCRLPIRICTVLREMATRSKSARITGTSYRLEPRSGATDRYQVPLELWPKFCGSPSAVPTIIRI